MLDATLKSSRLCVRLMCKPPVPMDVDVALAPMCCVFKPPNLNDPLTTTSPLKTEVPATAPSVDPIAPLPRLLEPIEPETKKFVSNPITEAGSGPLDEEPIMTDPVTASANVDEPATSNWTG